MKKFLVVLLALVMVFGLSATAFAGEQIERFSDIDNSSQAMQNAIQRLAVLNVVEGNEGLGGPFRPADQLTRAEFAKIVSVLAGLGTDESAEGLRNSNTRFPDVGPGHWFTGWVLLASEAGFFVGDNHGNFRPNANVTAQEVSTVLLRAAGYNDHVGGGGQGRFGVWPHNYNNKARQVGLLDGVANYVGNAAITRGDMAIMTNNALDIYMVFYISDPLVANLQLAQGNADTDWFAYQRMTTNEGDERRETILNRSFGAISDTVRFAEADGRNFPETSAWRFDNFADNRVQLNVDTIRNVDGNNVTWTSNSRVFNVAREFYIAGDFGFTNLSNMIANITYTDDTRRNVLFIEVTSSYELAHAVFADGNNRVSVAGRSVAIGSEYVFGGTTNFRALTDSVTGLPNFSDSDRDNTIPAKVYFDEDGRVYAVRNYNAFNDLPFGIFEEIRNGRVEYKERLGANADWEHIETARNNHVIYRDGEFVSATDLEENDLIYFLGNDVGVYFFLAQSPSEGNFTRATNNRFTIDGVAYHVARGQGIFHSEDGDEFEGPVVFTLASPIDEGFFGEVLFARAYNFDSLAFISGKEAMITHTGVITNIGARSTWNASRPNSAGGLGDWDIEFSSVTIINAEGRRVTYELEEDFFEDLNEWFSIDTVTPGLVNGVSLADRQGRFDELTEELVGSENDFVDDFIDGLTPAAVAANSFDRGFQVGMIVELRVDRNGEVNRVNRATAFDPDTTQRVEVNASLNRLTVNNAFLFLADNVTIFSVDTRDNNTFRTANVVTRASLLSSNFDAAQVVNFRATGANITYLYVVFDGTAADFDVIFGQRTEAGTTQFNMLGYGNWRNGVTPNAGSFHNNPAFVTYRLNSDGEVQAANRINRGNAFGTGVGVLTNAELDALAGILGDDYEIVRGTIESVSSQNVNSATVNFTGAHATATGPGLAPPPAPTTGLLLRNSSSVFDMLYAESASQPNNGREITSNAQDNLVDHNAIAIVENNLIVFLLVFNDTTPTASVAAQSGAVVGSVGGTVTFAVTTANVADGTAVNVTAGLPTGVTATATTVVGGSATITVTVPAGTAAGTSTLTVEVGAMTNTATLTIQ